jgi:hypothetical protein
VTTTRLQKVLVLALATLAPLAGACKSPSNPPSAPSPERAATATPTVAAAAASAKPATRPAAPPAAPAAPAAIKDPIRGLVSMGSFRFTADDSEPENSTADVSSKKGLLQGIVIIATWRSLQPTADGLAENNEIDRGLAAVRQYNAANPDAPLAAKLRVFGGYYAPTWAMDESGGQIHVIHTNIANRSSPRILGHVWSQAYRTRWAKLQQLLAAKYDAEPLIHEVAVTSCMMTTAEPFSIDSHPLAIDPLHQAGLGDAVWQDCLSHIVDDYAPWTTTRFETALNPFQKMDGGGPHPVQDGDFTVSWMQDCRRRAGDRCVFDNHDLTTPDNMHPQMQKVYEAMRDSGAEVEFQTFVPAPPDLPAVIRHAVAMGATSVELWQDYPGFTNVPDAQLRNLSRLLVDNRRP